MTTEAAPSPERPPRLNPPRLNPFVFPSETTFRFGLLVVAVLGTTLYVWNWIWLATADTAEYTADALTCLRLSQGADPTDAAAFGDAADAFGACVQEMNRPLLGWMLGGAGGLLLAAIVLTLLAPLWIERRRRLEPLSEEDAPAVLERLRELSAEAGLNRTPRFVWNPLDTSAGGLAFGHAGRYTVALTGGLVVQHIADPPAFDAIVRHELAHIRNRDVDTTYFTLAIWYAFLLTAVLPFAVTLLEESAATMARVSWRLLALAVLVYATRNAVLRSREVYADIRASVADGRGGALRSVLAALPPNPARFAGRLRSLHPEPAARVAAIDDTRPLFRVRTLEAFGAGVAATVAYASVMVLVDVLVRDSIDGRFLGALAFAPLVIGVVGFAIWRQAFANVADGKPVAVPWFAGLALAAGFLVGPELELARGLLADDTLLRSVLGGDNVGWAVALVAGLVLLTAWIAQSAALWLRALGARKPLAAATLGLGVGTAVLTVCSGIFYALRALPVSAIGFSAQGSSEQHAQVSETVWAGPELVWQAVMDPLFIGLLQRPLVVPLLALLWIYPLASAFVRHHRDDGDERWAFLDPQGDLPAPRAEAQPLRPLAIGAAVGAGFCALLLVLRFGLHTGVSAETRASDAFLLALYVWLVALAVLAQALAGSIAAAVSRGTAPVIESLAAGFAAGSIAALGIVGGPMVGGCVDPVSINPGPCAWTVPASFSLDVFQQVVAEGTLAALAGGLVVVGARAWLARRASGAPRAPDRAAAAS